MSKLFSFSIFFSSFTPLWLTILFIDFKSIYENKTDLWTEKIGIVTIIVVFLLSILVLYKAMKFGRNNCLNYIISNSKEKKDITTEYMLAYVLPLFSFDFRIWDEVVQFLIFFICFTYLCIRHKNFNMNIILELVGYKYYQCELKSDDNVLTTHMIVSKQNLNNCIGESISVRPLNNEYLALVKVN